MQALNNYVLGIYSTCVGTLVALFVDLKAVFDSVGRKTVIEAMRKKGERRTHSESMGSTIGD